MIKFFRKIRYQLLGEGKTGKYLKYAIGEIVLVVIGILIALYINNDNIQRQTEKEIVSLFEKALVELKTNINRCDFNIEIYRIKDSIYHLTMQDKITYQDYDSGKIHINWNNVYHTFDIDHNELSKLLEREEHIKNEFKEIFEDLKLLHIPGKLDVDIYDDKVQDIVENEIFKSYYKYPWYNLYTQEEVHAKIEYLINNPEHKKNASNYNYYTIDNLTRLAVYYRLKAIQIYVELANLLQKADLGNEFILVKDYSWMIGNWQNSKNKTCDITIKPKNAPITGNENYSSFFNYDSDGQWQQNIFILGNDNFGLVSKDMGLDLVFARLDKTNDDLFHMVTNKGDTITYTRVLD